MGIVNAGMLDVYEDITPTLRDHVEDALLNRREDATERLLDIAESHKVRVKLKTGRSEVARERCQRTS